MPEPRAQEARFNRLYERHFDAVRAYAWRRAPSLADEIVAETFLVAWRRLPEVPDDALPWLIGVARNVRANLHRSDRRRDALVQRLGPEPPAERRPAGHRRRAGRAARRARRPLGGRPRGPAPDRLGRPRSRPGGPGARLLARQRRRPALPGAPQARRRSSRRRGRRCQRPTASRRCLQCRLLTFSSSCAATIRPAGSRPHPAEARERLRQAILAEQVPARSRRASRRRLRLVLVAAVLALVLAAAGVGLCSRRSSTPPRPCASDFAEVTADDPAPSRRGLGRAGPGRERLVRSGGGAHDGAQWQADLRLVRVLERGRLGPDARRRSPASSASGRRCSPVAPARSEDEGGHHASSLRGYDADDRGDEARRGTTLVRQYLRANC